MTTSIVNISAYKFVPLDGLSDLRRLILDRARQLSLKGTVLLAPEGINLFVAGSINEIDDFADFLRQMEEFSDLSVKKSPSHDQPFSRMLVRIKKEIIAFGVENVEPQHHTSPKISAAQLKSWLDEGKDLTLLDVRNDYEVELGTFRNALPIGLDHFRDFPNAVEKIPQAAKSKPLVMFCTGGIRCEKAGPLMEQRGFEQVFQLDGGILKYFEEVGGEHYDGECFVFDKRVAVDPQLCETITTQCYACQHPLNEQDQADPKYDPPRECPYCFQSTEQKMRTLIAGHQSRIDEIALDLPGSRPYDHVRPLNVPGRFDQCNLIDFLDQFHPHVGRHTWLEKIHSGRIQRDRQPVRDDQLVVRGGQRFEHLIPQQIEPDVNGSVQILYQDQDLLVVHKPAPLPMHPCGRFNRNTLVNILNQAYQTHHMRIVHRLDADTTGVVVLARKARIARDLQQQFKALTVEKQYLALVAGHPDWAKQDFSGAISKMPGSRGSREMDENGRTAETEFSVERRNADQTSLIRCLPKTGRTNQIRIHLAELGFPIVGDAIYANEGDLTTNSGLEGTFVSGVDRLRLHAWSISFEHPGTGQRVTFETELPEWASVKAVDPY